MRMMNRVRRRQGFAIPVAVTLIFIMAMLAYSTLTYSRNQDAQVFHVVNVEKAKMVAESAIEAASLRIRKEMNNLGNANPIKLVSDVISMLGNPMASWYLKFRVPALIVAGGTTGQTGVGDISATAMLNVDQLGIPPSWAEQTLDENTLGMAALGKELGGDIKVTVKMNFKHLRPITSEDGSSVLWPGAVTDDGILQNILKDIGNELLDFLGVGNIKISISLGDFISGIKLNISVMGIPIPVPIGEILKGFLGRFATIDIDVGKFIKKALSGIISQLHLADLKPIKANVVLEKMGTLEFVAKASFTPWGSGIPVKATVNATKDIKVVDLQAPNPLYSFYWWNKKNVRWSRDDWGNTGGGTFQVNNLYLDDNYNPNFSFGDIVTFFKATFSGKYIRFPGMIYIGGSARQEIPTSYNEALMIFPTHSPVIATIPNYGHANWYAPWNIVNVPADGMVWFPLTAGPPLGIIGMGTLISRLVSGQNIATQNNGAKTQLFGEWSFSPTINLRIMGNVCKVYRRIDGIGFTIFFPFGAIGGMIYIYSPRSTDGYGYSFFEQAPQAQTQGVIENVYKPDQYKKKSTQYFKTSNDFNTDTAIRDENGVIRLDGVYYVDGPLALSGSFYGAGQIVANGDIDIQGNVIHFPKEGDKTVPFSIISMGKVRFSAPNKVIAPIYAADGVEVNAPTNIIGNLVCKEFDPHSIRAPFKIWYAPDVTTCSFLSLIPHIGRYMPDRYRVVMADQYSSYKYLKEGE